jgi:hypothetical protein
MIQSVCEPAPICGASAGRLEEKMMFKKLKIVNNKLLRCFIYQITGKNFTVYTELSEP